MKKTPDQVLDDQRKKERQRLLKNLPDDAKRVRVRDATGKLRWRRFREICDDDTLEINPENGQVFTMAKEPGRRKGDDLPNPLAMAFNEKRKRHLMRDELLQSIQDDPGSLSVLDQVMKGLAEEAAIIKFEQTAAENQGYQGVSKLALNRVSALKAVGDTWLNRKDKLQRQEVDLNSNTFKVLFGFITETFRDAMQDAKLRDETIDTVFNEVGRRMKTGWEAEARNRMKKA